MLATASKSRQDSETKIVFFTRYSPAIGSIVTGTSRLARQISHSYAAMSSSNGARDKKLTKENASAAENDGHGSMIENRFQRKPVRS
jgi:hypothetical protein